MLLHDLFEILVIRDDPDPSKDVNPKDGDCFMVFFRVSGSGRDIPQRVGHFNGCFGK